MYDKRRSTFHNHLSFQEARAITRVLAPEDRMFWYAWKEGWEHWKLLSQTSELTATTTATATALTRVTEPPPLPTVASQTGLTPLPESKPIGIDTASDSLIIEEPVQEVSTEGEERAHQFVKRKGDRIIGELNVEVICQGRKFKSVTGDVSVGGVRLKDPVPNWMAGYCTLILSRPDNDQKLEFVCSIVEDQELGKKYRLEIHPSKDSVVLKRWLLDMHIKNIKKNPA